VATALVLDDSKTARHFLRAALLPLGFEVLEAPDGLQGLRVLREHTNIALALVDWNMPEMSGLEFVREVRRDPGFDGLRMIMVTTEIEMAAVSEALAAGANEYLMKPFTGEMLIQKLALLEMGTNLV
jgi:two-component system chemotaxis response regulator CheY